jgi:hypothetical protein
MLTGFFEWLQNGAIATAIREGDSLFPWIESLHVLAITFVFGSIAAVDFRLLGWLSRERRFSRLSGEILPLTWTAFAIAVFTGGMLFSSKALKYADNLPFQLKMAAMMLAGVNMAVFHLSTLRGVVNWDSSLPPPRAARLAGGLSLLLWVTVIACGREIGFTMVNISD